jgi:Domain of unknown function (DUF1902)
MIVRIRAEYDPEAAVWVAQSDDIPLITQAETIKALRAKLPGVISDLIGEPAVALVRYSAPRPATLVTGHAFGASTALPGGLTPADRIAASLSAMIWTAAWWLIETSRSQASAALRFSLVPAVPLSIRSRIMSSLSELRRQCHWRAFLHVDGQPARSSSGFSFLLLKCRSISLPWVSPSAPAKIPKAQPNLR